MAITSDQPISTSNFKAALDAAEMKWGGGLPEARVLYYDPDLVDKVPGTHKVEGLDLDKYDGGAVLIFSQKDLIYDSPRIISYPYQNGLDLPLYGNYRYKLDRRVDGLYDIEVYTTSDYSPNSFYFYLILGIKQMTKITEVSTMAVSDTQPISAGNLKAALDGLTGGGRS